MPYAPFFGPRLKIDRAKHHISDIDAKVGDFLARNPNEFIVDKYVEAKEHSYYMVKHRPPPQLPRSWDGIVADAIHNLRAALDSLACDLVRINQGNPKDVYFPFSKTGNDLERRIKDRNVDRAAPDVVNIIRSLKPYDGGNQALWDLHELDIADKHGGLILVTRVPDNELRVRRFDSAGKIINERVSSWSGDVSEVSLAIPAREGEFQVGDKVQTPVNVVFLEGARSGDPILPTLHQMAELVDGIVGTLKKHCGR